MLKFLYKSTSAPDSPFTAITLIVIEYILCGAELMLLLFNGISTCERHLKCLAHLKKKKTAMKWSSFIADGAQQQNSTHVTSNPRATLNYWKD